MKFQIYKALVKKHNGWIEDLGNGNYAARFPTVHDCEEFQKEYDKLTGKS